MAREIERKFLVTGEVWRSYVRRRSAIRQAYLALNDGMTVRIRIIDGLRSFVGIKTARQGPARGEYEYPVPLEDAHELLRLRTGIIIEKHRHIVCAHGAQWEVDEFEGVHQGLVLAEIELPDAAAHFEFPEWLGEEVTSDPRYYNGYLATHSAAARRSDGYSTHRGEVPFGSIAAA
jgi:adenylate cyclase